MTHCARCWFEARVAKAEKKQAEYARFPSLAKPWKNVAYDMEVMAQNAVHSCEGPAADPI